MKKKLIILLLGLSIIIVVFIVIFLSIIDNNQNNLLAPEPSRETSIILFSDETCLPCREVENYIDDNNLADILDLSVKDVHISLADAKLFEEKFDQCISPPRTYGVPLLWHERNCILGPAEIIIYLNSLSN